MEYTSFIMSLSVPPTRDMFPSLKPAQFHFSLCQYVDSFMCLLFFSVCFTCMTRGGEADALYTDRFTKFSTADSYTAFAWHKYGISCLPTTHHRICVLPVRQPPSPSAPSWHSGGGVSFITKGRLVIRHRLPLP